MNTDTLYEVSRCHKDDNLYGAIHLSFDLYQTFCYEKINENWWLLEIDTVQDVTCKKCLKN